MEQPYGFAATISKNNATIVKIFRIIELCFALILLLCIFAHLPFAVKMSGEYFRQLAGVILSPLFIFFLSNFIVLAILFNSGRRLSGDSSAVLSDESPAPAGNFCFSPGMEDIEVVYEDKQMIFEETETSEKCRKVSPETSEKCRQVSPETSEVSPETAYIVKELSNEEVDGSDEKVTVTRKTQSEKVKKESPEEICMMLCEQEKCRKVEDSGNVLPESAYEVDELSNEEFRKAIDDFIAKQTKFHRQEKLAIVLQV